MTLYGIIEIEGQYLFIVILKYLKEFPFVDYLMCFMYLVYGSQFVVEGYLIN